MSWTKASLYYTRTTSVYEDTQKLLAQDSSLSAGRSLPPNLYLCLLTISFEKPLPFLPIPRSILYSFIQKGSLGVNS